MEQVEVILGVDTHLDVHVGAVISQTGKLLGTLVELLRSPERLTAMEAAARSQAHPRAGL